MIPAFTDDEHYYAIIVLGSGVIAFWFYVMRLKWFSLGMLVLASLINYFHLMNA